MDFGAILKYIIFPCASVGFSAAFSALYLLKAHSRRWRYAFRTPLAKISMGVNAFCSLLLYYYLDATGLTVIPSIEYTLLNSIFLAVLSAGLGTGIVSRFPVKSKSDSGAQTFIDAATWIHGTLQAEIDKLVNEEVIAISLRMQQADVNIDSLAALGNEIARYKFRRGPDKKLKAEFAKIDQMLTEKRLADLIEYIMNCNNSDPKWIVEQLEILEGKPVLPKTADSSSETFNKDQDRLTQT